MKKIVTNFIESIRALMIIRKHPSAFMLTESIFKFVAEANEKDISLITKIAVINAGKSDAPIDIELVHLWAGVGVDTPIKRLEHIRSRLNKVQSLLQKSLDGTLTENDRKEAEIFLDMD